VARIPDVPCALCGKLLYTGSTSLPAGERMCRPCRTVTLAQRQCSVEGCERQLSAKGYCQTHYFKFSTNPRKCGEPGCSRRHVAKGFCAGHYRREQRRAGNASYQGGGENNARGRARRHGVAYEPIRRVEVFNRDGWVCGICAEPVDPELSWPNPLSASLDHIVPMVHGGPHLLSNVQCSHLACNVKKKDSLPGVAA